MTSTCVLADIPRETTTTLWPAPSSWDEQCTTQTPLPASHTQTPWARATGDRNLCLMGTFFCSLQLVTYCTLNWPVAQPGSIGDLLHLPSRFNNNCQSPVTSVRQVAGDGINGIKVCSSTGVGWSRPGEGDAASRLGDKTNPGESNSNLSSVY